MKIVLILAAGHPFREAAAAGRPHAAYAPTTLIHLAALIPVELEADVTIIDQGVDPVPEVLDADLVAISAITCAAPEAYRIADRARSRGATVVLGGYHASSEVREALRHADTVVVGFAEESWPRLLRDFRAGRMRRIYRGDHGAASLPALDRGASWRKKYFLADTIEATRGCPNQCTYCVIGGFAGTAPLLRPVREVVEEIERMGRFILFLDPNPFAFPDYLRHLLQEMRPLHISWFSGAHTTFALDDALLELAVRSGCRGVLLGFESVNQESLDSAGKGWNRADRYREIVERLHSRGVGVLGCFAFGFDGDDPDTIERTVAFSLETKLDLVKYGILTPLPGSRLFEEMAREGRLITRDWERYDTNHAVFQPRRMRPEQLEERYQWAYRQTYTHPAILRRVVRRHTILPAALAANWGFRKFGMDLPEV